MRDGACKENEYSMNVCVGRGAYSLDAVLGCVVELLRPFSGRKSKAKAARRVWLRLNSCHVGAHGLGEKVWFVLKLHVVVAGCQVI